MDNRIRFDLEELLPCETASEVEDKIREELAAEGGFWSRAARVLAGEDAMQAIKDQVAQTDVFGLLAEGWATARELREHCDPAKHPNGASSFVRLGKHVLKEDLHPIVSLSLGSKMSPGVKFTLAFEALFEAVELVIENRHIVAARSGGCKISAAFKYRDTILYPKTELKALDIPGEIVFEPPGLEIRMPV